MTRTLLRAGTALLVLTAVACPMRRTGLQREALVRSIQELGSPSSSSIPTLAEARGLRSATPGPPPASLKETSLDDAASPLERVRFAAYVHDDEAEAAAAWADRSVPAQIDDLRAHRCLVEVARRRVEPAIEACGAFLDEAAGDPRAPAVLATLLELRPLSSRVDEAAGHRAGAWVAACGAQAGPSCPELAWLAFGAERRRASTEKDVEAAERATVGRGVLTRAEVRGPFLGDAHGAFAAAGRGEALKPRPVRYTERVVEAWDGVVTPALRGDGGLYRVRFVGDAARSGPARVLLRCGGPCRLRVGGETVLEHRPDLGPAPEVERAFVELAHGHQSFDVLTWAGSGGAAVELGVLDPGGRARLSPSAALGRRGRPAAVRPAPPMREPAPSSTLARIDARLLAAHLSRAGFEEAAEQTRASLSALVSEAGWAPPVLVLAARHAEQDPSRSAARAASEAQRFWRAVAERWPDHPDARLAEAQHAARTDPRRGLRVLDELVGERPDYLPAHRVRAPMAMSRGAFDQGLMSARALALSAGARPGDLDVALDVLDEAGRVVEEAALEERRARESPTLYSADYAEALLARGQTEAGLAELLRVCDAEPGHLAEERLWSLLELRDPAAALARVEAHTERFPNDRAAWLRRAQVAAALDEEAGLNVLDDALARFGGDRDLWALAEELGRAPPWADREVIGDERVAAWREREDKPFRGHPVVFVLDAFERHLFADQGQVGVRHVIVELKSEQAVDHFGEVRLDSGEELRRLRVIKPDGRILEPELYPGLNEVSLPGLEPGDLVEMISARFVLAGIDGFAFELRPLEAPAPAALRRYTLVAPATVVDDPRFSFVHVNGAGPPEVGRLDDGRKEAVFTTLDAPPVRAEPDAVADEETVRTVGFSLGVDEEAWARVRGGAFLEQARSDPWLDAVARKVAGSGAPAERMWRLWRFVQARIDLAEAPADAARVLDEGRGQRLPLLLALLRGAGLDADPVALHAPALGPPLDVPSVSHFSLPGIRIERGGQTSYVFGDGRFGVPDALPPSAEDGQVLDLDLASPPERGLLGLFGGGRLQDLPSDLVTDEPVQVQLDLEARGRELVGYLALKIPAHQAEPLRDALQAATADQARTAFERLVAPALPGAAVTEVSLPTLKARGEPLGVGVQLKVPLDVEPGSPVRLTRLFPDGASTSLGLFPGLSRLAQVAERKRHLQVPPGREVLELQVALEEGGTFTEAPEPASLEAGPVSLEQRVEVTDGRLYLRRELSLEPEKISPERWRRVRPALLSLAGRAGARLSFLLAEDAQTVSAPGEAEEVSDADRSPDVGGRRAGHERGDPQRGEGGARPGA